MHSCKPYNGVLTRRTLCYRRRSRIDRCSSGSTRPMAVRYVRAFHSQALILLNTYPKRYYFNGELKTPAIRASCHLRFLQLRPRLLKQTHPSLEKVHSLGTLWCVLLHGSPHQACSPSDQGLGKTLTMISLIIATKSQNTTGFSQSTLIGEQDINCKSSRNNFVVQWLLCLFYPTGRSKLMITVSRARFRPTCTTVTTGISARVTCSDTTL